MVGMAIRYGGRTLVVTAYVNTDEEPQVVYERVQTAARGPKAAMVLTTIAVTPAGQVHPLWAARGIPTIFDGRTLMLTSYINTDEALDHGLTQRVLNAANKPSNPETAKACDGTLAVAVAGGEAPLEEAREMWKHFIRKLEDQKNGPN